MEKKSGKTKLARVVTGSLIERVRDFMLHTNISLADSFITDHLADLRVASNSVLVSAIKKVWKEDKVSKEYQAVIATVKVGEPVIGTLEVRKNNEVWGEKWGSRKGEMFPIYTFGPSFMVKKGKSLYNKKTGLYELQDFEIHMNNCWSMRHFFFSNSYGNHVRWVDGYIHQFVETAKQRKTFEIK